MGTETMTPVKMTSERWEQGCCWLGAWGTEVEEDCFEIGSLVGGCPCSIHSTVLLRVDSQEAQRGQLPRQATCT